VDGDGYLWVSNFGSAGVSEFNLTTGNPITPTKGYYSGAQTAEMGSVAIDSSGNVWVSDWGSSSIHELVGAAAPTINPVAVATKNNTIGTRP
jgi:streptogramin lyase